jgi:deoxyinosine 3'endonuclease (endonuclease V)
MIVKLHNWNLTPPEAVRIQTELRDRIILEWDECPVSTIGGVDVSSQDEFTQSS